MSKIRKKRSLFVLMIVLTIIYFQTNLIAQYSLKKVDSYSIEISDDYLLPQLLKGVMDRSGNFYYCDLTKILKFDSKGKFLNEIAPIGRGPGEFQILIDCNVTDKYLVLLPFNEFKVLFYNRSDLTYSHEFSLENYRTRQFTTFEDSLFVTFNDVSFGQISKTISVYDIGSKHFLGAYIETPNLAYVGNTSGGGGIVSTTDKEVFFSFISYPGIWKYDFETGVSRYFDLVPEYFEESNIKDLKSLKNPNDHSYYRKYMFSKSRSEGIFLLGEDKIVQMIAIGNPWNTSSTDNEEIKHFLEIWDTNGNKLASKIPTPENLRIAFTSVNKIYLYNKVAFSEESDKLKKGENLELFSIYELITNKEE